MSIHIETGKTYNGMSWAEATKLAIELQKMGLSDKEINEMLERSKDEVTE